MNWTTPIENIPGVGPESAKALHKKKIKTVGDLLEVVPRSYYLPEVTPINEVKNGNHVIVRGRVGRAHYSRGRNGWLSCIEDNSGSLFMRWFGFSFFPTEEGQIITAWGKYNNGYLSQPTCSAFLLDTTSIAGGLYGGKLTPIIHKALDRVFHGGGVRDISDTHWCHLYTMHHPKSHGDFKKAVEWLKGQELLLLHLAMETRRQAAKSESVEPLRAATAGPILSRFPYQLTGEQCSIISDILRDFYRGTPMNRLLHGEVGSGKTAVAFYAAMRMALAGKRTLIICPTTILADQHYNALKGMGWDDVYNYCGEGCWPDGTNPNILIGTHRLLNAPAVLKSASLVVIDEFHKFGVQQRAKVRENGNPHILLMSATPIPRTLAMSVFGDLDVSTMSGSPVKRGTVFTRWVVPNKLEGMYDVIQQQLDLGHQVYVVYPRISSDKEDVENAEAGFQEISKKFVNSYIDPDIHVGMLTGQMSDIAKKETMSAFNDGYFEILVSTIIAEVGLDNPNATVMLIQGADRFGLSQLHQLRGRVCRSKDTAFCFLVSNTTNKTSIARLDILEKCDSGFELAEHDLKLRGMGDMFSERQHGIPNLKFADLVDDYKLSCQAKELAKKLVGGGKHNICSFLCGLLHMKYGKLLELGGVG